MTPNDIEILIHCHVCPDPHPRAESPAVKAALVDFITTGLIQSGDNGGYRTTAKGKALMEMICSTPLPIESFIDPRTGRPVETEWIGQAVNVPLKFAWRCSRKHGCPRPHSVACAIGDCQSKEPV